MNSADAAVLDQAGGLQQLMGDQVLYLQILRRFRQRYAGAAAETRAALAGGDTTGAVRIVHTLKGAAGMLGAQQLQQVAAQLEAASCALPLAPLDQALQRLLCAIDKLLSQADGAAAAPAPAPAPAAAQPMLVRHLARLLEDGDGAAIDVLEQSAAALTASLGAEVFGEVTAAAQQFDFDAALARLRRGPAP
ncbi:phosphotransfer domain-containing protein [Janthinobacterium sp. HH01]|uniref:Hpt domain-containing protein n=1 Tax=Janthinobacterium sp. HH01 TaxID=1198452 RepID=UPI0002AEAC1B|nr:Hpt domain-containing protein [Janthinobacterium sp. HH01]ELX11297.1 phosphotransfer domain-containing protein [Janthinobacterium sp. HH01]